MGKFIDLTNHKFGKLTVLKRAENHILASGKPRTMWLCKCECGKEKIISAQSLLQQTTISCGCVAKEKRRNSAAKRCVDIIGKQYGKLLVIDRDTNWVTPSGQQKARFICQCECGQIVSVLANSLKDGRTKSCGCERKRLTSERRLMDLTGQKFGKLTVLEKAPTRFYNSTSVAFWKCRCECGSIVEVASQKLRLGITQSCGCLESKGEEKIAKILSAKFVTFQREYTFNDLRTSSNLPLRFDFAIFNQDILIGLIEYQGIQHYVDYGEFGYVQRKYTDKYKQAYCAKNHYPLFEIRYDEDITQACEKILNTLHVNTVPSSELSEKV